MTRLRNWIGYLGPRLLIIMIIAPIGFIAEGIAKGLGAQSHEWIGGYVCGSLVAASLEWWSER